jgi:hypothetical protein
MTIRVLHWGTGSTGCMALHGIRCHPELELVGLFVARPERAGTDAGDFVSLPKTGIVATNDLNEFLSIEADTLSFFGSVTAGIDEIVPFLESGRNVVTTTYSALNLPSEAPPALVARLETVWPRAGRRYSPPESSPACSATCCR